MRQKSVVTIGLLIAVVLVATPASAPITQSGTNYIIGTDVKIQTFWDGTNAYWYINDSNGVTVSYWTFPKVQRYKSAGSQWLNVNPIELDSSTIIGNKLIQNYSLSDVGSSQSVVFEELSDGSIKMSWGMLGTYNTNYQIDFQSNSVPSNKGNLDSIRKIFEFSNDSYYDYSDISPTYNVTNSVDANKNFHQYIVVGNAYLQWKWIDPKIVPNTTVNVSSFDAINNSIGDLRLKSIKKSEKYNGVVFNATESSSQVNFIMSSGGSKAKNVIDLFDNSTVRKFKKINNTHWLGKAIYYEPTLQVLDMWVYVSGSDLIFQFPHTSSPCVNCASGTTTISVTGITNGSWVNRSSPLNVTSATVNYTNLASSSIWNSSKNKVINNPDTSTGLFSINITNTTGSSNRSHVFGNGSLNKGLTGWNITVGNTTELPICIESNDGSIIRVWYNKTVVGASQFQFSEGSVGNEVGMVVSNCKAVFSNYSTDLTSTDGWTVSSGGTNFVNMGGFTQAQGSGTNTDATTYNTSFLENGQIFEVKMNRSSGTAPSLYAIGISTGTGNSLVDLNPSFAIYHNSGDAVRRIQNGGTDTLIISESPSTKYHVYSIERVSDSVVTVRYMSNITGVISSYTWESQSLSGSNWYVGVQSRASSGANLDIAWARKRQVESVVANSWGVVETPSGGSVNVFAIPQNHPASENKSTTGNYALINLTITPNTPIQNIQLRGNWSGTANAVITLQYTNNTETIEETASNGYYHLNKTLYLPEDSTNIWVNDTISNTTYINAGVKGSISTSTNDETNRTGTTLTGNNINTSFSQLPANVTKIINYTIPLDNVAVLTQPTNQTVIANQQVTHSITVTDSDYISQTISWDVESDGTIDGTGTSISKTYNYIGTKTGIVYVNTSASTGWDNQTRIFTTKINRPSPAGVSGVYGFLNNSMPDNSTILNYRNNNILTVVITLDWDNISSTTWNSLKQHINYSYTNNIRTALRLNVSGDYTNKSVQNNTKNNITNFFPDTKTDPYESDISFIEINFTNTTSPSADKGAYANIIAQNISEQSNNKFPVYTIESVSGLNSNYVSVSPIIYLNVLNNSDFVSKEMTTTRGNTTKSRVYSGNETTLSTISAYKTMVLNKFRGALNTSHPNEYYAVHVNNGTNGGNDIILFNNASTTQNMTIANKNGTFLDTNNDILRVMGMSNGTLYFNVSGENFTYAINEAPSKLILNTSGVHDLYGSSTAYDKTFSHGENYFDSYIYAGSNNDVKTYLFDPTYSQNNTFIIHYEWINSSGIVNYTPYKYIIISDKNPSGINTTINRTNSTDPFRIPYLYVSVGDYVDNGGAWVASKKTETAWATSRGLNVFVDGIDIAVATGGNFAPDVKAVIDDIRINNSKKAICNTYTAYQQFATYCDIIMKESAFSRWDGTVGSPTYSWEDMTLEKQRAEYYSSHGIPVIGMSFGDVEDYEKKHFDYMAFAVVYGLDGNNSFRYGQPNFQNQKEIYEPDLGTMLEDGFTETSTTDWNRLYSKGRVHIDPVGYTSWVDNNKVINSINLSFYLYSGGAGSGDRNVTVTLQRPNSTYRNLTYDNPDIGIWGWRNLSLPTSEYKEHGHYPVYWSTRPVAGGYNFIGKDNTANTGNHSFYDTTTSNVNNSQNDTDFSWTALGNSVQWMVRLEVNYTTTLKIDTINQSLITQTNTRSNGNNTTTITSTNEYNVTAWSNPVTLNTTTISNIWFKATNGTWISANLPTLNTSNINTTEISEWVYTTIEGKVFGVVQKFLSSNKWLVRFLFPDASSEALVTENIAPAISNVSNQTANEGDNVYIDIDGSDSNGDSLTFSTNRSDLFTDFSSSAGKGNWSVNYSSAGTIYVDFGVSDGISNTNQTMTISVNNIPLSITASSPSGDVSVTKGTSQLFSITLNRAANATVLVDSTTEYTNTSVTIANYTHSGAATGTFNITINATDGVDTVRKIWNLTVSAAATTTTTTSSASTGIVPLPQSKQVEQGVRIFTTGVILSGDSARIPIVSNEKGELPSLRFLNLFFNTPYSGGYTFTTMTYATYSPALEGAREYFAVSPSVDMTKDSNLEISSTTPIAVYQLLSDNTWYELRGTQKLSENLYGVPITSLGVFAIKEVQKLSLEANQVAYVQDKSIAQKIKKMAIKVRKLIESPPTIEEIKVEIEKAVREGSVELEKAIKEMSTEAQKITEKLK